MVIRLQVPTPNTDSFLDFLDLVSFAKLSSVSREWDERIQGVLNRSFSQSNPQSLSFISDKFNKKTKVVLTRIDSQNLVRFYFNKDDLCFVKLEETRSIHFKTDPRILATGALYSCIGIVVIDRNCAVLCHYMTPRKDESMIESAKRTVTELQTEMRQIGGNPEESTYMIIGGNRLLSADIFHYFLELLKNYSFRAVFNDGNDSIDWDLLIKKRENCIEVIYGYGLIHLKSGKLTYFDRKK